MTSSPPPPPLVFPASSVSWVSIIKLPAALTHRCSPTGLMAWLLPSPASPSPLPRLMTSLPPPPPLSFPIPLFPQVAAVKLPPALPHRRSLTRSMAWPPPLPASPSPPPRLTASLAPPPKHCLPGRHRQASRRLAAPAQPDKIDGLASLTFSPTAPHDLAIAASVSLYDCHSLSQPPRTAAYTLASLLATEPFAYARRLAPTHACGKAHGRRQGCDEEGGVGRGKGGGSAVGAAKDAIFRPHR